MLVRRGMGFRLPLRSIASVVAAAIRRLFSHEELSTYLSKLEKKQSVQDRKEDWVFDSFEDAELEASDVIDGAEKLLALERAKELLL